MFQNREAAGRQLAARLADLTERQTVVLGLPRGGVVVARPVADALEAPLDVLVARKIGAPGNPEFAIGAVTARGTRVLNDDAIRRLWLPFGYMESETTEQRQAAASRETLLRGARAMTPLAGQIVVLVDDGVATGMTMRAAIEDVRVERPAAIVVAAPVMALSAYDELARRVDRVVALEVPAEFDAVGEFYRDFAQTSDAEVLELLAATPRRDRGR